MPLSEPEIAILKKYRIMKPDGSINNVPLTQPLTAGGPPPGPGPLMAPDAYNRLLRADTTEDKRWLDWIFFQAGGGEKAKTATADALKQIRERFIDELKAGRAHPAQPSMMKYYGTELNKRRYEILMSAGGIDALEWESPRSKEGARPRAWLRTKANSIEGGTSEVMLGIVAKRILDLPGA